MQVGLLGPLEVRDGDGRPVDVAGARLRTLLARLALDAGRPVSIAALVDAVWGDSPPADSSNALQTLVSRLRRAFGDTSVIVPSPAGYRLAVDAADVDAHCFEELLARAGGELRAGRAERGRSLLTEALALWRGDALADAGEFAAPYAARLHDLRLAALVDRIGVDVALGEAAAAAPQLETLHADHPLNERIAALLVTALASVGRQADALQAFERTRRALADQLGVDPSAELQEAHLAVLRGETSAPVAVPPGRRTNLKAQLTSFVGREDEVARIAKALDQHRLVTLVGPGGAGKTRLAAEAAVGIADTAPDGVWLVELAPVTDGGDVPQAVLGSLGLRETQLLERRRDQVTQDAVGRLLDVLTGKRTVLILDNCEHLIEASARLAGYLLEQCPDLRIVTTSREPLGIFGEALLAVPPLGQPVPGTSAVDALDYPAVRLFADRAGAVRPDFEVDETTVDTVVEIVHRLDGLPLAIELAAARLRTMSLADIAARLSDRFRLLTGGSRTALPRHRTLRAVVEWSWDLLTADERLLAERLAVFPAGVTPASAAAVCADGRIPADDVADLLSSLVDKSLLQPVGDGSRTRMLETIREYGVERLADRGELAPVRRWHADHFARVLTDAAPHLTRADQLPWFDLLNAERDNILAGMRYRCDIGDADGALEMAVGIGTFAMLIGTHAEISAWMADALAVPGATDRDLVSIATGLQAVNSVANGADVEVVERGISRLHELSVELGGVDTSRFPVIGLLRPAMAMFAEDAALTEQYTAEGLASPDPWLRASVRMLRANMAENDGDIDAMRADLEQALAEFRELGERWGLAATLREIALVRTLDGDLDGAETAYAEALTLMREMGSREDEVFLLVRQADLAVRRGDPEQARRHVRTAYEVAESTGSPMDSVFALAMLAQIERHAGVTDRARQLHAEASERIDALPPNHPVRNHGRAIVLATSAVLTLDDGDAAAADRMSAEALEAAVATRDMPIVAAVGVVRAEIVAANGQAADAARLLGATARLRGAEDATSPDIIRLRTALEAELGADGFAREYAAGRALGRDEAVALLSPARP